MSAATAMPKPGRTFTGRHVAIWNVLMLLARNQRENWPMLLITSSIVPFVIMSVSTRFGSVTDQTKVMHLLAGNIVLSLLFGPLMRTAMLIAFLRERQVIEHFATLPIRKTDFLTAVMLNCLGQSLPGIAILLVLCRVLLSIRLTVHPLLLPVAILASLSMATIGASVGVAVREFHRTRMFAEILMGVLMFLSPGFARVESYPFPLFALSKLLPSSYAVHALRDTLCNTVSPSTIAQVSIVAAFTVALLWFSSQKLDWNVE